MIELFAYTMSRFHLNIRVSNAYKICYQLNFHKKCTYLSTLERMFLKAYIFHLPKSPGYSSPYIERAEHIFILELTTISCVLGRYLFKLKMLQFATILYPSFRCICNYIDFSLDNYFGQQRTRSVIKFFQKIFGVIIDLLELIRAQKASTK